VLSDDARPTPRATKRRVLAQKPRDLEIGVQAVGQAPEDLHDEPVAEDHRRVALLALESAHRDVGGEIGRKGSTRTADEQAALALHLGSTPRDIEQRAA